MSLINILNYPFILAKRQLVQSLQLANMLKILLLLLVPLTSAFGEGARYECPEYDKAWFATPFDTKPNFTSWEDCGRFCAMAVGCEFWRFKGEGCYLYKTVNDLQNDQYGDVSGERGCPEDQKKKNK